MHEPLGAGAGHRAGGGEHADRLIARTLDTVARHVRPSRVAIYRRVDDGYVRVGQEGAPEWPHRIDADDSVFVALRAGPDEQDLATEGGAPGRQGMAFPMSVAGRLQGTLVCGERAEHYTSDERQALRRVARDVSAALLSLQARENERLLDGLARGTLTAQDVVTCLLPARAADQGARLLPVVATRD